MVIYVYKANQSLAKKWILYIKKHHVINVKKNTIGLKPILIS